MKIRFLALVAVLISTVAGLCCAYPEPAIVPGPSLWTLDVQFEHPLQITVKMPGGVKKRFWYTILTLTNNSRQDASFYPACELMTDTFQVTYAGKDVTQAVFRQIKLRHQNKYPFLESLDFVDNNILQGVDNTRDIAVIWPDFDPKAKNVTVFIAGLSNETIGIDHPVETDSGGKPVKVYLRKTLALDYAIGGDERLRAKAKLAFKSKKWIMR